MDGARSMFLVVFLCLAVLAAVQSPAAAHTVRSSELLLLADGQLIEFPFSKRPDGYEVRFPGGPQFIESSRVLCVAESRADAWKHLRSTFPSLTPEIHLSLAKWCIRYQLEDCAERELLDALNLDPNRTEAMQLLEKITGRRLANSSGKAGQRGSRAIPGAPGMAAPASRTVTRGIEHRECPQLCTTYSASAFKSLCGHRLSRPWFCFRVSLQLDSKWIHAFDSGAQPCSRA
ncbi:MAG UNVERIFIED_CONTAM: hypothetical protein LVR18_26190 [Planctomycetaceae bacterium]